MFIRLPTETTPTARPPAPRVSIGLAVFNGERYLAEVIDSLLAQTFTDFELIISDNASTDRTAEICQAYTLRDQRITYTRNPANLGAAPNLNRTAQFAHGEYFKWLFSDDPIEPQFLERCVALLDGMPDVVLVYPHAWTIDENGTVTGEYVPTPDMSMPEPHRRFEAFLSHPPNHGIQSGGLMRLSALKAAGYHPSATAGDEVMLALMSLQGKFWVLPDKLARKREHPGQSTTLHPRLRVGWMDSRLSQRVTLHRWQYLHAAVRGVLAAPIGARVRVSALLILARWSLRWKNLRTLVGDFAFAVPQFVELHTQKGRIRL